MRLTAALPALVLVVAACSKHDDRDGGDRVARLEVAPNALLLAAPGDQRTLTVIAYDAADQQIELTEAIVWTSTHGEVVTVSEHGEVVAVGPLGSSQIVASVGAIAATPVTVVVAQVAPGAVTVGDAQIAGAVQPLGPDSFTVLLEDVAGLAIGAIVLSGESIPLAGRVTAMEDAGGGAFSVTMATVKLDEAFTALQISESYAIPRSTLATVANVRENPRALTEEFDLGPFECEAKVGPKVEAEVTFEMSLDPTLDVDWVMDLRDGVLLHHRFVIKGGLEVTVGGGLEVTAAFTTELECKLELTKFVIPIGGAVSFIVAPVVPFGIGFSAEGAFELAQFSIGVEGKIGAIVSAGYDYTPAGGFTVVKTYEPISEFTPKAEWPGTLTEDIRLKLELQPFAYVSLAIDAFPYLSPFDLKGEVVSAKAGPAVDFDYGTEYAQATDTAYASTYGVKFGVAIGPGEEVEKILNIFEKLGVEALSIKAEAAIEVPLAESPSGSLTASDSVVDIGDTVNFTVTIAGGATFLGIDNVAAVIVKRMTSGGSLVEIGRQAAVTGRTVYTIPWTPDASDLGNHKFVAYIQPNIFGQNIFPSLEVDDNSQVQVAVHDPGAPSGDFVPGAYRFSHGPTDCLSNTHFIMYFFANGAVSFSNVDSGHCTNGADQVYLPPIGNWELVDSETLAIDFCSYLPARTVTLTWNGTTWAGTDELYNPTYLACLDQVTDYINPGTCIASNTCVAIDTTCNGTPLATFPLGCNEGCCHDECPNLGDLPPYWDRTPTCY